MEPRIQYAKTSDGVSIAYWAMGEGPPLVRLGLYPGAASSQMYSNLREYREFLDVLSRRLTLVHYDFRGTGHSERSVSDFSIDSLARDLESVVDRLGFDRFALYANSWSAPVSFAYAAMHASRVSHLILWHGFSKGPDLSTPLIRGVASMLETDWNAATEAVAHFQWGFTTGQNAHLYAAALRASVTPETFRAQWEATSRFNTGDLLPLVTVPTLLFHRRGSLFPTDEEARHLAAQLPDARLVLLDRSSMAATHETVPIVEGFLGLADEVADAQSLPLHSGMTAILFADIVDSTALTERLGDAAFRKRARDLDGALRAAIRERGGTPVEGKLLGDGVLAVFTSAREAIVAALACGRAGDEAGLPLHLGIHAGDVIREENNVYGGAVNIASRIAGLSAAGEVLVSETVRSLARTSAGVRFEDRGEQELKGVGEAVRVWAVAAQEPRAENPKPGPE